MWFCPSHINHLETPAEDLFVYEVLENEAFGIAPKGCCDAKQLGTHWNQSATQDFGQLGIPGKQKNRDINRSTRPSLAKPAFRSVRPSTRPRFSCPRCPASRIWRQTRLQHSARPELRTRATPASISPLVNERHYCPLFCFLYLAPDLQRTFLAQVMAATAFSGLWQSVLENQLQTEALPVPQFASELQKPEPDDLLRQAAAPSSRYRRRCGA